MIILFMADVPQNPDSGAAGTEFQTVEALRALGHDVDAVWADDMPHRIRHGNLHYLIELPRVYRKVMCERLESKEYDVVHVNQPYGYLAAKALRRKKSATVFIHRSHGFELRVKRDLSPWIRIYEADDRPLIRRLLGGILSSVLDRSSIAIAKYADGHIVSCSQCCIFLQTAMGVPQERIAVIPQAPPPTFSDKTTLPMTHERLRRVLYVGQFTFSKAPMILAAVFDRLAADREDIEITWVCSKDHHGNASELLKAETRKRVKFLDWSPQEELINVYDTHGIFLFPSFFEGFGKVFLEAMSRGLCVIAANNGGAHDVISSGGNGILVPTGNVEAMVNAYLELMGNLDMAAKISSNASASSREYTWERVAKETVAFYRNTLNNKFGPGY